MAYIRRLPSGLYQATVRRPDGRRISRSDPLRKVVRDWARETEAQLARGAWRDPALTRVTVGDWHERWLAGRVVEPETARGDKVVWRTHLKPHWEHVQLVDVTRSGVQSWVKGRLDAGVGRQALRRAFNYLRALLEAAVHEDLMPKNPCRGIATPAAPPKQPEWFTADEVDAIVEALDEPHATMTLLMVWAGPRWGEAAALRGTDVDWLRGRVRIERAMSQAGREKDYPKTSSSRREVPVPAWILKRMSALMTGRGAGDLVFVTRRGGRPLSASNWRTEWAKRLEQARVRYRSPHVCRHTAASWLVQEGTPLYDVQRQLGHSSYQVTQRYAHLAPDAHDAVTGAWERLREARDA